MYVTDGTHDLQSYFNFGVGSGEARAHFSNSGQNVRFDWKFGVGRGRVLPWASRGWQIPKHHAKNVIVHSLRRGKAAIHVTCN